MWVVSVCSAYTLSSPAICAICISIRDVDKDKHEIAVARTPSISK